MRENILKASLIFGGGFLIFWFLKPKEKKDSVLPKASFDSEKKPKTKANPENASIVVDAYVMAHQSGESKQALDELNNMCLDEYGMKCEINGVGDIIVSDADGNRIAFP